MDGERLACTCCGTWVITHVRYSDGDWLRVTHRGLLIGPGRYRTVAQVWAAIERWGGPAPQRFAPG